MSKYVFAYYNAGGQLSQARDKAAMSIMEARGGKHIGKGIFVAEGEMYGERDIQYELEDDKAQDCVTALKKAGFRAEIKDKRP